MSVTDNLKIDGLLLPHPSLVPAEKWNLNPQTWPALKEEQIKKFLIEDYACDGKPNAAHQSFSGMTMYLSGWVGPVFSHLCSETIMYLKGKVCRSQAVKSEEHEAWICLKSDGQIQTASCSCMAGLAHTCSHVAAILFKVLQGHLQGLTKMSCTDIPLTWNTGSKRQVNPEKMKHVDRKRVFSDVTPTEESPSPTKKYSQFYSHQDLVEHFRECPIGPLVQLEGSVLNKVCNTSCKPDETPASYTETRCAPSVHGKHDGSNSICIDCGKCSTFFQKFVKISTNEIKTLSEITVGQSERKDHVWENSRVVRITASTAKKCPKLATDPTKFLKRHCYSTFKGNKATKHGLKNEAVAKKHFKRITGFQVVETGTVVSDKQTWLSASPDGLVGSNAVLEVKCPVRNLDTLLENGKYDVTFDSDYHLILKENGQNGYYLQCQLTMYCTNRKLCYLCLWSSNKSYIVQVKFNSEYVKEQVDRLEQFYFTRMLPYLCDEFERGNLRFGPAFYKLMSKNEI